MRILSAIAVFMTAVMAAAPAQALEFDHLLKMAFGTSDMNKLGGPIFALIGVVTFLFFWIAIRIGKKRQRRMIESYDAEMKDYSTRLRRGKF
ncbi:hypothetical protein IMCC20628_02570 [Hoeflea sp. IMCC20628]|uniref:hypothetical protein n=1 Tax=Hoeflea sp. IMCC20628 TaxID=1620421 RepID=UPI00063AD468|nr:hypothetical protein [Hoeflea sp. IMCC20628]AKI01268.1 hypothetical protein IMCC20628_02570 [Hoeflea sp. IMCC20628]